jgi:hypothetical protein
LATGCWQTFPPERHRGLDPRSPKAGESQKPKAKSQKPNKKEENNKLNIHVKHQTK